MAHPSVVKSPDITLQHSGSFHKMVTVIGWDSYKLCAISLLDFVFQ
jgi:hypothetical protein